MPAFVVVRCLSPLADRLEALAAPRYQEGLLHPFVWCDAHGERARYLAAPTGETAPLETLLPAAADRLVRVVNVVLVGQRPDEAPPLEELRRAVSARTGADRIVPINLLIPANEASSLSEGWRTNGWHNLLLAPYEREEEGRPTVGVTGGQRYLQHALGGLATVAGLWSSIEAIPLDDRQLGNHPVDRVPVTVVQTRSRTITARDLGERIVFGVFDTAPPWPLPNRDTVNVEAPAALVRRIARQELPGAFADDLLFDAAAFARPLVPPPGKLDLRELLALVRRMLTRDLPEELRAWVVDTVDQRVQRTLGKVEQRLQAAILGADSAFAVSLRGEERGEVEVEVDRILAEQLETLGAGLVDLTPPTNPTLWSTLRQVGFCLVDGRPMPPQVEGDQFVDGTRRRVVTDPQAIAPDPTQVPWWTPPAELTGHGELRACDVMVARAYLAAVTAAAGPPTEEGVPPAGPAARDEAAAAKVALEEAIAARRPSLCWQLGEHLADQIDAATDHFDRYVLAVLRRAAERDAAEAAEAEAAEQAERRRHRRRLLLIVLLTVAAVTTIVLLGPVGIAVTVGLAVIAALLGLLGWLVSRARTLHRLIQLRYRREEQLSEVTHALTIAPRLLARIARLRAAYRRFLDWAEIIGWVVHHPFGQAVELAGSDRTTAGDLGLAHRSGTGEAGNDRAEGWIARLRAEEFRTGWLGGIYDEAARTIEETYRIRTGTSADPDADVTLHTRGAPEAAHSARRFLLQRLLHDDDLLARRERREDALFEQLSTRPVAELFDEVARPDGSRVEPLAFLRVALGTDPGARFDADVFEADPDLARWRPIVERRQWVPTAAPGDAVPGQQPSKPLVSQLGVQAVVLELSGARAAEQLRVLGEDTGGVDLARHFPEGEGPRQVLAPPARRGRRSWRRADVPPDGSVFRPGSPPALPEGEGGYSFMVTNGDEPARFPPAAPIRFVLRPHGGPAGALDLLFAAVDIVATAAQRAFEFVGTTDEGPDLAGRTDIPGRPVWIGFGYDEEVRYLREHGRDTLGLGGPNWVTDGDGTCTLVRGSVVVRADGDLHPGFGAGRTLGNVVLHELGHLLNLGHVDDPAQQMAPSLSTSSPEGYGPGDLRGFRETWDPTGG